MSGYGGYAFAKFDNTTEWTSGNREDGIAIIKKMLILLLLKELVQDNISMISK